VTLHAQARAQGQWLSASDLEQATKGGQYALHSQSVQALCSRRPSFIGLACKNASAFLIGHNGPSENSSLGSWSRPPRRSAQELLVMTSSRTLSRTGPSRAVGRHMYQSIATPCRCWRESSAFSSSATA
jgi:hypothetical protein